MPDFTALNSAIDSYESQSYGSEGDGGELSRQRALALDAFQGKNIEPAPEGRSQVVDWSVFETVQWILPSLTRIFASGDDIVEFEPLGPDDEDVAKQESEVLNYIVTQKNNWFLTCVEWFQDALITKNAYCMVFMEEKLVPEIERYERQSEEQLALLLDDDVEVVGQNQYNDPTDEGTLIHPNGQPVQDEVQALEALMIYQSEGVEPQLQYRQLYDVEIRKTKATQKMQFQVLPPERVLVGEDTPDFTLEDCNYFEYFERMTISDLRKSGIDVDDEIAGDGLEDSREDIARDDIFQQRYGEIETEDPAMKQVKVRTIWIRHDYDGDGIAELQKVIRVGNEILVHEPASRIPVACIVPFLNTHRHMGASVADLTFDIQRIKTSMLRSGIDSLNLANNPRHAVSEDVVISDMLVSRPGALARLRNGAIPGQGHIMPIPTENTFPYAQQGLIHMDSVTEARVGVTRQFQGIDANASNDHNRIGQLSTMAAQRVEQIARLFANGVERLFSLAHEVVIKSGHSMEAIKLRGQWIDVDPSQWRTGRDMRVTAPFAAGNKDSLVQRLMVHMQVHREALAGKAPFVQVDDSYELAKMLASATDVPGDRIYTDPATLPPPEPQPNPTMIALEIEDSKVKQKESDSQRDAELKNKDIDTQAALDKYRADLQAQTQITLAQINAGEKVELEKVRAMLKDTPLEVGQALENTQVVQDTLMAAVNQITNAMAAADERAIAPIKIVRDAKGKITGKKIGDDFVPIEDVK